MSSPRLEEQAFIPDDRCSNCGAELEPIVFLMLGSLRKPMNCDRCGWRNRKDFRLPCQDELIEIEVEG